MENPTLTLIFDKRNVLIGIVRTKDAKDFIAVSTAQEVKDSCENRTTTPSGYSFRYVPNNDINYKELMGEITLQEFDKTN